MQEMCFWEGLIEFGQVSLGSNKFIDLCFEFSIFSGSIEHCDGIFTVKDRAFVVEPCVDTGLEKMLGFGTIIFFFELINVSIGGL